MTGEMESSGSPLVVSERNMREMGEKLKNSSVPMAERFRILFTLRNINNPLAIELIGNALSDKSVLLKHELAYCLGQMGNTAAIPVLNAVLENEVEDPMVRHEAGEYISERCINGNCVFLLVSVVIHYILHCIFQAKLWEL